MKVAFVARPNLFTDPGGDTIQIKETAKALLELGVEADILVNKVINYNQYDLFHFFNIIDPEDILGHLPRIKVPYVVSTIYVNYREYDKHHRSDIIGKLSQLLPYNRVEYFKTLLKFILGNEKVSTLNFFIKGHKSSIQHILEHCSCVLPNSESEYLRLKKDYHVSAKKHVVPNGVDKKFVKEFSQTERSIVLCVGRLEGRKNQLNVIRALKNSPYNVVFIGLKSSNQKKYVDTCLAEATSNMKFIDHLPQEELLEYYQKARVHVLASWFETTGLVNLEAAAMGCKLVLSNRGDVKDYFKHHAIYCEPNDLLSIKNSVDLAWNAPNDNELRQLVLENYTWEKAAIETKKAYVQIINP